MFPAEPAVIAAEISRLIETIPLRHQEIARLLGRAESTLYRWRRGLAIPKLAEMEALRRMASGYTRTLNGKPERRETIPFDSQPPRMCLSTPERLLPGISQTQWATMLCFWSKR